MLRPLPDLQCREHTVRFEVHHGQAVCRLEAAVHHALEEDFLPRRRGGIVVPGIHQQGEAILPQDASAFADLLRQGGAEKPLQRRGLHGRGLLVRQQAPLPQRLDLARHVNV